MSITHLEALPQSDRHCQSLEQTSRVTPIAHSLSLGCYICQIVVAFDSHRMFNCHGCKDWHEKKTRQARSSIYQHDLVVCGEATKSYIMGVYASFAKLKVPDLFDSMSNFNQRSRHTRLLPICLNLQPI